MVLKTLVSPLGCKEIKSINPKGNQSWIFTEMNIHWCWSWNSDTLATWYEELIHWKRPWYWARLNAGGEGDDRGWMNGWHHRLGHEFKQALGVHDGQGSLVCWSPCGHKELDMTQWLNWFAMKWWDWMSWSSFLECCILRLFHSPLHPNEETL